jgi:two-component system, NtrC family, sensor histidine kinase HydH
MSKQGAAANDQSSALLALGEVSAEVMHELRNELAGISAAAFALQLRAPAPELERIRTHAMAAQCTIEDLFALLASQPLRCEAVNMHALCTDFVKHLPPAQVTVEVADDSIAYVHTRLVQRCLQLLTGNALQCGGDTVRIQIAGEVASGSAETSPYFMLFVRDTGPGIAPEIAAQLFTPLATARAGGTGLGLALARRIAEKHGGGLELVASTEAWPGAGFVLRLPARNNC